MLNRHFYSCMLEGQGEASGDQSAASTTSQLDATKPYTLFLYVLKESQHYTHLEWNQLIWQLSSDYLFKKYFHDMGKNFSIILSQTANINYADQLLTLPTQTDH